MGIVIIGGHDRMVCKYKEICKSYQCKVKVFTQMPANMKNVIGSPDLLVLFTNTVSHKMIHSALKSGEKTGAKIVRSHSSSACALHKILDDYCSRTNCHGCPNYLNQPVS
ncbi:MAG: hypothetical protein PWP56_312 [Acetobacterium sp.]|jgi:glutamate synthase domain-containing protein 2|uniref:DUF2325 domain-containing protein n=1 Tax=Acetobacterium sp. K1/6 TaxID=3055467 RepID=UPI0029E234FF|nr:DUF2325 domain-containing protein [Acetobacterium sp. K1/6]MDK2940799.1 hypothetical protein [Acetobacterium sp.]MDZ5726533.1 DUF2325 domain-containing protein [Acetobacterium sp. K1/6]